LVIDGFLQLPNARALNLFRRDPSDPEGRMRPFLHRFATFVGNNFAGLVID
jgi:hypothetical protein